MIAKGRDGKPWVPPAALRRAIKIRRVLCGCGICQRELAVSCHPDHDRQGLAPLAGDAALKPIATTEREITPDP